MFLHRIVAINLLLAIGAVQAQEPAPAGMSLAEAASRRFPQPVRVGDLLQRQVLEPKESQSTLGWVQQIVKNPAGGIEIIVNYGGLFGFFTRPIAVPVEAMVLLGQYMEIVGFTPAELDKFKKFDGAGAAPLPPDSVIKVGLARPSH